MAETKKKSQYNFGGHNFDAALYLQNLRDNAESFLNSKTDWTPEQKEEWKHSYTNFTNALQDQINNNTDRFSTDEFGTITDRNGEFSNTDADNFYYNNKGQQISQEDYDKLKTRKQNKFQTFEANRQFASYANQVGKSLRDALAARKSTSDNANGFDYAKNGFASFWNNKYNPSGEQVDRKLYWALDKDGQYTNRIAQTLTDLDEYLKRDDLPDDVRANIEAYKNKLQEYSANNKDFNVEEWKNGVQLAASRAGLGTWNNGFFNMGSQDSTTPESNQQKPFDINNDQDVINKYNLAEQIAAHPEQREHLLDLARRQYNQESQDITDQYNAAIKQEQDAKNNKIWEQYLLNNPYIRDVNKRVGRTGTTSFWSGARSTKKAQDYVSQTIMSQEEQDKVHNNMGYVGKLRPEVQAALTGAHWDTDNNPLLKQLNVSTTKGLNLKNLGNWYQYNWDQLMARRDSSMKGWTPVKDNKGNEVWRRNDSLRASDGTYFYMFMGRDGKLHTYRSKPYSKLKAEAIAKGQLGMSIYTKQGYENAKKQQQAKAAVSKQTAQDKGRSAQQQKNMERTGFTGTDIARLASIGMDMGSLAAAYTGPETMGIGTLVSAGLGVGSTATNLVADLVDGENTWEALKTAGYGLGMDTLGLIPGAGTASKLGKIGKTAIKYVPRILAYLGTIQGVQNMPYIVNSFKKLGTNQELTVDDYRNMAQGIGLITGIGAAGGRKIRNNKTTQQLGKQKVDFSKLKNKSIQVKQSDQVALRFKDKQGNTKSFVFKGNDANAIKNAKNNEEIKTENPYEKCFGPLYLYDACDLNYYTVQVYIYTYILRKVYHLTELDIVPLIVRIGENDFGIYSPIIPYSDKLVEDIISFAVAEINKKSELVEIKMAVYIRRSKKLTEDDQQQQQQVNHGPVSNASVIAKEIEKCNQDIIKCQNAINIAEQRYQEEKKKQNNNISQLQQRIAELGGTAIEPAASNESVKVSFRFSKKLYEAVQNGKTDELADAVAQTFNSLPNLSYFMDEKGCYTLAKRLLSFLNEQSWNDGNSHWDEVTEFLTNTLTKANISLSSREMRQFIDEFGNELKRRTMFSWIFGRDIPVEETEMLPAYNVTGYNKDFTNDRNIRNRRYLGY